MRPFTKTAVFTVAMSVRLSVRPFGLFSAWFETWDIYLGKWRDTSSLRFISIRSLWPTYFTAKRESNSFIASKIKINPWSLLYRYNFVSRHRFRFSQKSYLWNLDDILMPFMRFEVFRTFFYILGGYQFETWYIHLVGGMTHWIGDVL